MLHRYRPTKFSSTLSCRTFNTIIHKKNISSFKPFTTISNHFLNNPPLAYAATAFCNTFALILPFSPINASTIALTLGFSGVTAPVAFIVARNVWREQAKSDSKFMFGSQAIDISLQILYRTCISVSFLATTVFCGSIALAEDKWEDFYNLRTAEKIRIAIVVPFGT